MTPWVQALIAANVVVYFLQRTVPGVTRALMFVPAWAFSRPWTPITYMFVHDPSSFGHIFFNMLGLYFFGVRVEARMGSRRFITLYLLSGLAGALLSFVFSPGAAVIGASGAVFGVTLAFARFWPRDQIYIWGILPVEARWLVVFYALISLFGIGGGIAHFAHLGGFAGAFLYLVWLDRTQGARRFRQAVAPKVAAASLGNWHKVDATKVHEVNREELNRILDKINASGLASLSPTERQFLASFVPPDDRGMM